MGDPRKDRARKKRLRRRNAAWRRRQWANRMRDHDFQLLSNLAIAMMLDPEIGVLPPTLTTSRVAELARLRLHSEVAFHAACFHVEKEPT